jgi:hypothetical protein
MKTTIQSSKIVLPIPIEKCGLQPPSYHNDGESKGKFEGLKKKTVK